MSYFSSVSSSCVFVFVSSVTVFMKAKRKIKKNYPKKKEKKNDYSTIIRPREEKKKGNKTKKTPENQHRTKCWLHNDDVSSVLLIFQMVILQSCKGAKGERKRERERRKEGDETNAICFSLLFVTTVGAVRRPSK